MTEITTQTEHIKVEQLHSLNKNERIEAEKFSANHAISCGEIQFSIHSSQLIFVCAFCGKPYNMLSGFLEHAFTNHLSVETKVIEALITEQNHGYECENIVADADDDVHAEPDADPDDFLDTLLEKHNQEGVYVSEMLQNAYEEELEKTLKVEYVDVQYPLEELDDVKKEFIIEKKEMTESRQPSLDSDCSVEEFDNEDKELIIEKKQIIKDRLSSLNSEWSGDTNDDNTEIEHITRIPKRTKSKSTKQMDDMNSRFSCLDCGKLCMRTAVQVTHCKKHSTIRPFACDMCDATFAEKQNLQVHRQRHLGIKEFLCPTCGKAFISGTELKLHERSHTNERPYKCNECSRGFVSKSQLDTHKRRHRNDRPYKCDICSKRFYDKRYLREHLSTHSDQRPFACTVCESRFGQKKTLAQHMKLHLSDKTYKCAICAKQFTQSASLSVHKKRVHWKEPSNST